MALYLHSVLCGQTVILVEQFIYSQPAITLHFKSGFKPNTPMQSLLITAANMTEASSHYKISFLLLKNPIYFQHMSIKEHVIYGYKTENHMKKW